MNQLITDNIQPKVEALQKENTEILEQIEMIVKVLERRKAKYESNAVEIHKLNKILEGDFN